ncbi:MAG: heavy metal translocating P-type ATPase, partial [Lachnospiraceae bacterium]|nr:heavy metal translocating P-type ATPase [Lachnospiraceae bacterium]
MKFKIEHEIKGRLRIHLALNRLTYKEADSFEYYLNNFDGIKKVKVYERTADAVIFYDCNRMQVINYIRKFSFDTVQVPEKIFECSSRELEAKYSEKIITSIVLHYGK